MKIACISASRVPSSTANSMQLMKSCQALFQLGHDVHLFLPGEGSPPNSTNLKEFYGLRDIFPVSWLPSRPGYHRYDLAWRAARHASHLNADLTYVWFIQAGIFSLLNHLPVVYELHGPPEGRFGPTLFRLFLKMPGRKRLLPITHALANQLSWSYRFNPVDLNLFQVSPNGVDLERYTDLPHPTAARQQLGLSSALTIGYTGHLYPGRGVNLLVQLAIQFPQVQFLWVGGTQADVSYWRHQLEQQNISNVTLTGFISNKQLPLYQAACEILLMPYEKAISGSSGGNSATYASPMKMFEYMASRRAIITSDLPVIHEVLDTTSAIFCPADDTDAWSQAFSELISDEGQRSALAEQAWIDVQQYTWLARARRALQGFPQSKPASHHE
ncbi:MAG: hypothetical protein C3F13_17320 [Anaerolineales bacterium]|nr:glycosyltransferase family 4 protein [Anaerolineae bacterium]PWB50227.1 MAG: hypothetical protein C3F13_17320 [Anaerolineales bacterium]